MKGLARLIAAAPFAMVSAPAWGAESCQSSYGITIEESTESEFVQAMMDSADEQGTSLHLKSQTFTAQGAPDTDAPWQLRKACQRGLVKQIVVAMQRRSLRLIPQEDLDRLGIDPSKFVDRKKYVPFGMRDQIAPITMTINVLFSDGPRPACTTSVGAAAVYVYAIEPAEDNGRDWGVLTITGAGFAACARSAGQIFVKYSLERAAAAVRYYLGNEQ